MHLHYWEVFIIFSLIIFVTSACYCTVKMRDLISIYISVFFLQSFWMLPHCLSLWCRWCTVHGVVCAPNCSWFPLGSCGLLYFLHKLLFWNSSSFCSVLFHMKAVRILSLIFFFKKRLFDYFPTLKSLILINSVKYSSYLVSWEWVYGSHLLWGTELCVLWEAFIFLDRFFFSSVQSTCKIPPMQQTCKGVWALMVCFLFCFWDMLCFTLLGVLPDTEIAYT